MKKLILIVVLLLILSACAGPQIQTQRTCWSMEEVFYEWNYNPYGSYFYFIGVDGTVYAYCVN